MDMKYIYAVIGVVIVAAVVISIFFVPKIIKSTGPSFNELLTKTNGSTYTANYTYYIYYNIAGRINTESYSILYSQENLTDRYIVVRNMAQPQMSLYIVMTKLSNGTLMQCIAEPLSSGCFPTNQTFNLISLILPVINASSFNYVGMQKLLNQNTYCYMYRNTTALGYVIPSMAQYGLGSLPVNFTEEACITKSGVPLMIKLSAYTTLSVSGLSAPFNITQTLIATSIENGVYLSNNATLLLKYLGVNATSSG